MPAQLSKPNKDPSLVKSTAKDPLKLNAEMRKINLAAFTMYCRGIRPMDIAEELKIDRGLVSFWVTAQKWIPCRARLLAGEDSVANFNTDGVPETLELAVELMEVQSKAIKFLNSKTLAKAAEFANELTPEEAFKNIRNIKMLAEASSHVFGEVNNVPNSLTVNIGQVIRSVKIPEEKKVFDVQLEIAE